MLMRFQELLRSPDKHSMAFFLEYPDRDSDIAFLVVNGDGTTNPFESGEDADNLTKAMEIAQIEDPQARLLIDIYRDGNVKKTNVKYLGSLLTALDSCDQLLVSLFKASDEGRTTDEESERLTDSIYNLSKKEVIIADKDGLSATGVRQDGSLELFISTIPYLESAYGKGSREAKVANVVNANAYVYQTLVSWHPVSDGTLIPKLIHPGETITLGQETAGEFHPLASVTREPRDVSTYNLLPRTDNTMSMLENCR